MKVYLGSMLLIAATLGIGSSFQSGAAHATGGLWDPLSETITVQLPPSDFRTELLAIIGDVQWAEEYGTFEDMDDATTLFIEKMVEGENLALVDDPQGDAIEQSATLCGAASRFLCGFFRKIGRRCRDNICKFNIFLYCWYKEQKDEWGGTHYKCRSIPGEF